MEPKERGKHPSEKHGKYTKSERLRKADLLFDYMAEYAQEHGISPTQKEIVERLKLRSFYEALDLTQILKKQGRISGAGRARGGYRKGYTIHGFDLKEQIKDLRALTSALVAERRLKSDGVTGPDMDRATALVEQLLDTTPLSSLTGKVDHRSRRIG